MTIRPLTPYDTGRRLEPMPWVLANTEAYGRVDFDDDEGRTVAMVFVDRDTATGRYVVHVSTFDDDIDVLISR